MNSLRNFLIGGLLVVTFLLFIKWNEFQERNAEIQASQKLNQQETLVLDESTTSTQEDIPLVAETVSSTNPTREEETDLPSVESVSSNINHDPVSEPVDLNAVEIKTDTLRVLINPLGGEIAHVSLLQHYAKLGQTDQAFVLLDKSNRSYSANLSLLTSENGKSKLLKSPLKLISSDLSLDEGEDTLIVDFQQEYQQKLITKRFTFTRDSYLINVEFLVENNSSTKWTTKLYGTLTRDSFVPGKANAFAMRSFTGFAMSTPETNYEKFSVTDDDYKESTIIQDRWLAFVQHYFVSAWIPEKGLDVNYSVEKTSSNLNKGKFYPSKPKVVLPGETVSLGANFYSGPKDIRELQKLAPHLDKTIDYGFLWFIAKPLFLAMDNIHSHVSNWGIAIILVTLAIKALFFYPSAISYRSMAKMRKLQPMMQELKERYGENKQQMSQELMKLYKREKVNPLSGCLPILLQMPVFIALYWMIMESVELRHSPFFFWIQDLSVKDPWFVLPLLMGVSMFIQQKLNPTPPDPMQAKVMQMLPIVFTFLFLFFPAGLVLYWVINNTLSIMQQYVITKQIENSA